MYSKGSMYPALVSYDSLEGLAPLNKPIPGHKQTCSESVRCGQFENIMVKQWNGEHLIDSRYKNHQ